MNQRMNEEKNALPMTRGQIENFIKENYKTKLTSLFTSLQLLLSVFDKSIITFLLTKCKCKLIINNHKKSHTKEICILPCRQFSVCRFEAVVHIS